MKSSRVLSFLIIISTIVVFLLVIFFLCIILRTNNDRTPTEDRKDININTFQMISLDLDTNEISYGFATSFRDFEMDENYYIVEDSSMINMYSRIGLTEYVCTGTCFCEESNFERRTSSSIFSRPLLVLVASVSSILALEMAKNDFQDGCEKSMIDACPTSSHFIKSEVKDCKEAVGSPSSTSTSSTPSESGKLQELYICKGNCFANRFDIVSEYLEKGIKDGDIGFENNDMSLFKNSPEFNDLFVKPMQDFAERFDCEKLSLSKEIDFLSMKKDFMRELRYKKGEDFEKYSYEVTPEECFIQFDLQNFCLENSKGISKLNSGMSLEEKKLWEMLDDIALCTAFIPADMMKKLGRDYNPGEPNPSVKCRRKSAPSVIAL